MSLTRALGLLAVAYGLLLLFSVIAAVLPARVPVPDVTLLVALHAGLTCRMSGGATPALRDAPASAMAGLGLCLGYLADLVGGAPKGLHALSLALLTLALRSAATQLLVRGTGFIMAVAALAAALFGLMACGLRVWADPEANWSGLRTLPGQVLATALFAPFMFALLRRMDARLWHDPRAQGLSL